jgi:hypothetical protein
LDAARADGLEPRESGADGVTGVSRPCNRGVAADPNVLEKSGGVFTTPALAREYGFTDVDGKQQSAFWDEHWASS